jgi:hypothetical protein
MTKEPNDEDGASYRVGYKRPPKETRFQKGNRANPYGRGRKGREDFAKAVFSTHERKVVLRQGGHKRTVTRREANIIALDEQAKRGHVSAAERLLDLHEASTRAGGGGYGIHTSLRIVSMTYGATPRTLWKIRTLYWLPGDGIVIQS